MDINIEYRPSYAMARVALANGESIVAESGAMMSMSSNIDVQTSSRAQSAGGGAGGLLKALGRSVFAGESFFMNTYSSQGGEGEIILAPTLPGDVEVISLQDQGLMIQRTSYMANSPGIGIDTKWGGMKTLFGGEGLFMIKAGGTGDVVVNSFGAIHQLNITGPYVVDTGHIVAFDENLMFEVKKVGSWKSTIFSGEGLVTEFNGRGRLWIQSRNPSAFGHLVGGKLPPREQ